VLCLSRDHNLAFGTLGIIPDRSLSPFPFRVVAFLRSTCRFGMIAIMPYSWLRSLLQSLCHRCFLEYCFVTHRVSHRRPSKTTALFLYFTELIHRTANNQAPNVELVFLACRPWQASNVQRRINGRSTISQPYLSTFGLPSVLQCPNLARRTQFEGGREPQGRINDYSSFGTPTKRDGLICTRSKLYTMGRILI